MIPEGDEQQARLVTKISAVLHYPGLGNGPAIVNKELGHLAAFARDFLDHTKVQSLIIHKHPGISVQSLKTLL